MELPRHRACPGAPSCAGYGLGGLCPKLYRNLMAAGMLSVRIAPLGDGRENGLGVFDWLADAATDRLPIR